MTINRQEYASNVAACIKAIRFDRSANVSKCCKQHTVSEFYVRLVLGRELSANMGDPDEKDALRYNLVANLYEEGMSVEQIAIKIKKSVLSVNRALKRKGLK